MIKVKPTQNYLELPVLLPKSCPIRFFLRFSQDEISSNGIMLQVEAKVVPGFVKCNLITSFHKKFVANKFTASPS